MLVEKEKKASELASGSQSPRPDALPRIKEWTSGGTLRNRRTTMLTIGRKDSVGNTINEQ